MSLADIAAVQIDAFVIPVAQLELVQAREYLTKALEILERLGTLIVPDKVRKELRELV